MREKVKGFMLRTKEMIDKDQEQLFALYENGTIKTCVKTFSSSFYEKGVNWQTVERIPENAVYIGNYRI